MIELRKGNLLDADAQALVNTVNCVGYMGKGIALQFKQAYPENFGAYQKAVRAGLVQPGKMFVHETGFVDNPRFLINFPTKRHWRGASRLEDIQSGLVDLIEVVRSLGIQSIAVPPLGCGLGGLDWEVVRPLIEEAFQGVLEVKVLLFEPAGAPEARTMQVGTKRPRMTSGRALLVKLMQQYLIDDYRLTLLEIQKLAYFLQEGGEPMRLDYVQHIYGPFAHKLNKALETMEGHFTRGYGDSPKPDIEIELLPKAVEEADEFLADRADARQRLERVSRLIDGFETPYGMELLASVHWVSIREEAPARDPESAITSIGAWNARKKRMFQPHHIRMAWQRLKEENWLPVASGMAAESGHLPPS